MGAGEWVKVFNGYFLGFIKSIGNKEFTFDDIRDYVINEGLEQPTHPNWWGIAASSLKRGGLVKQTNRFKRSVRASNHGRNNIIWERVA